MPKFEYTARTEEGEMKQGILEAPSKSSLARRLRDRALILTYAVETAAKKKIGILNIFSGFFRVSDMEKLLFTRHLSIMLKAGLSLSRALSILTEQAHNRKFKKVLSSVKENVEGGKSFADSLAEQKIFDPLYVNMVQVGELGGNLEEVLDLLAIQMLKSHNLKGKVQGAMIYPAIVVLAMIAVGAAMMIFVIPKLVDVFEGFNIPLPLATRILIASTKIFNQYWYFFAIAAIALVFFFRWFVKIDFGKKIWHKIILKTPYIKNLSAKINVANFARNLSILIKSGMPIVQALKVISTTFKNIYYTKALEDSSESVKKGIQLGENLGNYSDLFPGIVLQMIAVGEETGSLDDILTKLADFYENEIDQQMKNISSIIEPILMIIVGIGVAIMAISIISPIYSLMGQL